MNWRPTSRTSTLLCLRRSRRSFRRFLSGAIGSRRNCSFGWWIRSSRASQELRRTNEEEITFWCDFFNPLIVREELFLLWYFINYHHHHHNHQHHHHHHDILSSVLVIVIIIVIDYIVHSEKWWMDAPLRLADHAQRHCGDEVMCKNEMNDDKRDVVIVTMKQIFKSNAIHNKWLQVRYHMMTSSITPSFTYSQ